MAVHIETGSMAGPQHYSSQALNHLGLVAGMYDELGLGELISHPMHRLWRGAPTLGCGLFTPGPPTRSQERQHTMSQTERSGAQGL